jgi:hypothetical protein
MAESALRPGNQSVSGDDTGAATVRMQQIRQPLQAKPTGWPMGFGVRCTHEAAAMVPIA